LGLCRKGLAQVYKREEDEEESQKGEKSFKEKRELSAPHLWSRRTI